MGAREDRAGGPMTWLRGYLGSTWRDGLAGSWGGHAIVSLLALAIGVGLAWAGPSLLAVGAVAFIYAVILAWGERGWLLLPLSAPVIAIGWWAEASPLLGGFLGATVALVFYALRETATKRRKLAAGEPWTEQDRLDMVGDLVGSGAVWGAAIVMYGAAYLP